MENSNYLADLRHIATMSWYTISEPFRIAEGFQNPKAEIGSVEEIIGGLAYGVALVATPVTAVIGSLEFLTKTGLTTVRHAKKTIGGNKNG